MSNSAPVSGTSWALRPGKWMDEPKSCVSYHHFLRRKVPTINFQPTWSTCVNSSHLYLHESVFSISIRPKETWAVLKSHIQNLLPQFIFPLICITHEEVQEFQDEPEDYARAQFGEFCDDLLSNPSTMAAGFILALGSGRKKAMFMNLLAFITDICAKYVYESSTAK